ncbi:hypothetical protein [Streptomyces sp. NPDC054834]
MPAVQRDRLRQMREYYTFMAGHLEALLSQYAAIREKGTTGA